MKFLDHMTLGQYLPVDSLVHHLDPRCKILGVLVLMGALFVGDGAAAMGAWAGVFLALTTASRIPVSVALRGARPVAILIFFTAAVNLFFSSGKLNTEIVPLFIRFLDNSIKIYRSVFYRLD